MDQLRQKASELAEKMFSFPAVSRNKVIIGVDVGTDPVLRGFHVGKDPVFEIGAGILHGGKITTETFKDPTRNHEGEKIVLELFRKWLRRFPPGSVLCSYNGMTFDIPILLMRSWYHHIPLDRELGKFKHFDIYRFLKNLKAKKSMREIKDPSMSLKVMEVFFGFHRTMKTRKEGERYLTEDVEGLLLIVKGLVGG